QGGGLYEGTISCTDPVRDFECAARINASTLAADRTILNGTETSGTTADFASGSLDDTYDTFTENGASGKMRLGVIWTYNNASPGVTYRLRVEGFKSSSTADDFQFFTATRTSGSCNNTESYGQSPIVTLTSTVDTDTVKEGNAGVLPSGSSVF